MKNENVKMVCKTSLILATMLLCYLTPKYSIGWVILLALTIDCVE